MQKTKRQAFPFMKIFQKMHWIYEKHFERKYYSIIDKINLPVSIIEVS